MSDNAYEPYVILERSAPSSPRRWTVLRGRKPAVLLIDRGGTDGAGLDHPLATEGFDVYRTTGRDSALDLLEAHPSVLMALVRMDLPSLDAATLLRDLRDIRPGLWMGMLCDPADKTSAAAGYASGAVDLFPPSIASSETIARLIRSVPWALRMRTEADRGRRRRPVPWYRRAARIGPVVTFALALVAGVAMAALTHSWHASRDQENARIERILNALEAARPLPDRVDRQIDRWQRQEQLDLQRRSQESLGAYHQAQLEQERLRDLLRLAAPRYPSR